MRSEVVLRLPGLMMEEKKVPRRKKCQEAFPLSFLKE
jgi:hypothetical protein